MKRLTVSLLIAFILLGTAAPTLAQLNKPTPTPLPPGTPVFDIPDSYSLWASTDYAVQSWNLLQARTVIQAFVLLFLVAAGLFLLTRFIKELTQKDSED